MFVDNEVKSVIFLVATVITRIEYDLNIPLMNSSGGESQYTERLYGEVVLTNSPIGGTEGATV